jgi:hypothetical protein
MHRFRVFTGRPMKSRGAPRALEKRHGGGLLNRHFDAQKQPKSKAIRGHCPDDIQGNENTRCYPRCYPGTPSLAIFGK